MNKLWVGVIGAVLLLTAMGVYFIASLDQPGEKVESVDNIEETTGESASVTRTSGESSAENPFGEDVKTPLSEKLMQQYIHAMSHQKVAAKEKWSFFEITDERLAFLQNQLEVQQYKNETLYADILSSWQSGDFSNAVSQHNAIWNLQDGSIGEATGLLSPKEEEAFKQDWGKETR
ncbi:DUF6241 domain-containing protein [Rossellomorea oryzaecorticis]|uniref:DUF6241 domain-containing protein n=1 Tax=Rossellomorea oryzaecorticis TaxID=1396505 RepID=A0ABW8VPS4_9BACI